jgi:hypothetical protein
MKALSHLFKHTDAERRPAATPTKPDAQEHVLSEIELDQVAGGSVRSGGGGGNFNR